MKRWISLLLLPLLSCGQKQYSAAECRALAAPKAYLDRCVGGKITGKYVGDLKCWPFSRPQRLKGILRGGFEQSDFYPNATNPAEIENKEPRIWFESQITEPPPQALQKSPDGMTHTWVIETEGRLSLCDGWFGHLGVYPREFIATRIISARAI